MEIVRDLRQNWVFVVMKMIILGLVLTLIYQVVAFAGISKSAISRSFSSDAEVDMYGVTDTLADPDAFSSFRESGSGLILSLVSTTSSTAVPRCRSSQCSTSPFQSPDFRGGPEFDASLEGGLDAGGEYVDDETGQLLTDVRSFQMNERAFDFYSLEAVDGPGIDWSEVDYSTRTIPVILGADYSGIYAVGDVVEASYYFEDFSLVVSGFLPPIRRSTTRGTQYVPR
ncbi:hypothetical protein IOD13_18850 [Brevibacterium casei]|nr:hypothetical protein [Brevibacterium casei]